jgi:pilus assembly protein Flp/PilA
MNARRKAYKSQLGQGMLEYALGLVLIALTVIAVLAVLGHHTNTAYCNVSSGISGATNAAPGDTIGGPHGASATDGQEVTATVSMPGTGTPVTGCGGADVSAYTFAVGGTPTLYFNCCPPNTGWASAFNYYCVQSTGGGSSEITCQRWLWGTISAAPISSGANTVTTFYDTSNDTGASSVPGGAGVVMSYSFVGQ